MSSAILRKQRLTVITAVVCLAPGCDDRKEVVVALADGEDLREGAPVSYVGVRIGEVDRIELGRHEAVVTLRVDESAPLRTEDSVVVGIQGFIGDREVRILPGAEEARALRAGDTLRNVRVDRRVSPGQLLEAVSNEVDSSPE